MRIAHQHPGASPSAEVPGGPLSALKKLLRIGKLLQNLDNSWSLRFGPMTAHEAGRAVSAFLR